MLISVITVCYNSAKTIEATIESVLTQECVNLEYLIIDGKSKDETVTIAESYREKFIAKNISYIIKSEPDKGIYDAMNKGIALAKGDIIGILNSDDCYACNDILSSVQNGFEHSGADTLYGNLIYVKDGKPFRYWRSGKFRTFLHGWMPPHPSFFVKKEIYQKFGMFRLDCGVNADYELMLRLLEKNKVSTYWIDKVFVNMSAGGTSDCGLSSRIQGVVDNKIAWEVNDMKPPFYTVYWKKLRKIPQFIAAKFIKNANLI